MQTFNSSSYKPNSIVINENEIQDRLYIIVKGKVRVTRKFKKVKPLLQGDVFWQIGLFMKLPCYYTYSVDKDELKITFERIPQREELDPEIKEQLVIEYYSK